MDRVLEVVDSDCESAVGQTRVGVVEEAGVQIERIKVVDVVDVVRVAVAVAIGVDAVTGALITLTLVLLSLLQTRVGVEVCTQDCVPTSKIASKSLEQTKLTVETDVSICFFSEAIVCKCFSFDFHQHRRLEF